MNPLINYRQFLKKQTLSIFKKFGYTLVKTTSLDPYFFLRNVKYHAYYHGVDFLCPADSVLGQWVLSGKTWDPHLVNIIEKCSNGRKNFTICEVGSNIGASIIPVMKRFPNFNYILIEASPYFIEFLYHNTQFFPNERLTIHHALLSDKPGQKATLVENHTTAGRTRKGPYGVAREYQMKTTTLDILLEEIQVDFLKIDTDGFEFPILRGATKILHRDHPDLLIEFTPDFLKESGEDPQKFLEWLVSHNYNNYFEVFNNIGAFLGQLTELELLRVTTNQPNNTNYVDIFIQVTPSEGGRAA